LLKRLEADIRNRCEANRDIDARLRAEYERARSASRTAQAYEVWREDYITQVAVAWILACVFVRFLEDNRLIDTVWLAGPGDRLRLARDQHEIYFQSNPAHSDREYLEHVFQEVAKLPSMRELLDGSHNPISKLGPTGDGAHELLEFWQKVDPSTGVIIQDFTDQEWNTRFLGDLYQDLSESARDCYALLQTPEFVEEFILDRTLTPAVEEFGYSTVKMIDPACGSGHFLLGSFQRLLDLRLRNEPGVPVRAQVEAALAQVFGVDINPFAAAIARFRLLVAALKACETQKLTSAPAFQINVVAGDSLLHGPSPKGLIGVQRSLENDPLQHYYDIEDAELIRQFLGHQYHVVVGNPPYITVKDQALNQAYRNRFRSCHMKYSLAVPFKERFFDLAVRPDGNDTSPSGFVGIITANSFMKREFGKKLIEEFLPRWDITHVVDTQGAYIPGHTTATVILFARNRRPVSNTLRAVMGIRGEPEPPADPARGVVWRAILEQIDRPGSASEYVSVVDAPRAAFHRHPWNIGGGGIAELKTHLDETAAYSLGSRILAAGFMAITGEDEFYTRPVAAANRSGLHHLPLGEGGSVREWTVTIKSHVLLPDKADASSWPYRASLRSRLMFGKTPEEMGHAWYSLMHFSEERFQAPLLIAYSEVATHNHFTLAGTRGEKTIYDQTAPVLTLKGPASQDDHFAFLALLNSSLACFWMKQVCNCKGLGGQGGGIKPEDWHRAYQFSAGKLLQFPVPQFVERVAPPGRSLHDLACLIQANRPETIIRQSRERLRERLDNARHESEATYRQMVALQEELDWLVYSLFHLCDYQSPGVDALRVGIHPADRPVERDLKTRIGQGESSIFYDVHQHRGTGNTSGVFSPAMEEAIKRRTCLLQTIPQLRLLESPNFKRRWQLDAWNIQEDRAVRDWLVTRLEESFYWTPLGLRSCAKLADAVRNDAEFLNVAGLYRGRDDFDMTSLITELIEAESVPMLPVLRYTDPGLRKRNLWERTWDMQRREDAIDAEVEADDEIPVPLKNKVSQKQKSEKIGDVQAPPKYDPGDFQKHAYWSLRGKLDVPKERFISFQFCERDVDPTLVLGWAGWDHLQQAQAIAAYYERVKNQEGWTPERRVPLLVGILEILPWLKQWHNDIHPQFQERMGDFFQQFVEDEARAMEITREEIRAWKPPVQTRQVQRRGGDS
jgi:hypothetical protein